MTGPAAPVARVRVALRRFLEARLADATLAEGDRLLIACSGGPDSLALASQAAFLAPRLGLRAGSVTVDHAMQPGSAASADRATTVLRDLGLDPVLLRTAGAPAPGSGPEAAAREVRYPELQAARAATGARAVLLGHTADDQAESVLLALGRGSGTRSLAGMAAVRDGLWRPLLTVRRRDTLATCEALGLAVETDPSNAVDGPWRRADGGPLPRAAVRAHVLPALTGALGQDPAPALARTAAIAREDADLLEQLADAARHRCEHPDGGLDVEALAAQPVALRMRVLRAEAVEAGAADAALARTHLEAVDALLTRWCGQGPVALPGGVQVRRACGRLLLEGPVPVPVSGPAAGPGPGCGPPDRPDDQPAG